MDPSDTEELARAELESQGQAIFENALSDLPQIGLDLLFNGIDENAPVCDLDESGGEFTVSTGTKGSPLPCSPLVIKGYRRF